MDSIKKSETLQAFLESSERLQEEVNDNLIEYVEEEHCQVSEKIQQSKFAYLVMKHNYYRKVNDKFTSFNEWARTEVQKVKELEQRIIEFKTAQEAIITKSFRDMLSEIVVVDGKKPVLVDTPQVDIDGGFNPEEFKEGFVTEKSALTFLLQESRVMSLDLVTQRLIEIETLSETFSAKLLPISNKNVLAVGG